MPGLDMKIDNLDKILSVNDLEPDKDRILIEKNGSTHYTTLYDIQEILNTRDRPSAKTAWNFIPKTYLQEALIQDVTISSGKQATVNNERILSAANPLTMDNNTQTIRVKIAGISDGSLYIPSGVRRVLVKAVGQGLAFSSRFRTSGEVVTPLLNEKSVAIFPLENIQDVVVRNDATRRLFNNAPNDPGNYYVTQLPMYQSDKETTSAILTYIYIGKTALTTNEWLRKMADRNAELGPLSFPRDRIPSNKNQNNIDPIDQVTFSLAKRPDALVSELTSFQILAYSNFG